ncbi:MAG TPA: isocitrate/isopropylmalate dehydrogenase family protein [Candidatus Eisenbacteria bacterium]|nr:isocitrate/isopropylmalate dehydrogenase family protein [Candidatus Eisenbacteria bacterium]
MSADSSRAPHPVTLIPGDGIGPEITAATVPVLEATGVRFAWDLQPAGEEAMAKEGTPLPPRVLESLRRTRVGLKGPITTPVGTGFRSVNVSLRQELDLYACVRPCRVLPGVRTRFADVDLVVIRENTEDLYAGIEFAVGTPSAEALRRLVHDEAQREISADSGVSLKPVSRTGSRRIVRYAFEYARRHGRKKVAAVHKANIMKFTDGLFLEEARAVAREYPDIAFEERIVDALCMLLVQHPESCDVLVLPNLYGDIVSDLAAGLVGGLGVAPGANMGEQAALFEPTHGSAPSFRGSQKMNPTAQILSGALLLHHLGEEQAAARVERAVARVIAEGRHVTADVLPDGSTARAATTTEMAQAIAAAL